MKRRFYLIAFAAVLAFSQVGCEEQKSPDVKGGSAGKVEISEAKPVESKPVEAKPSEPADTTAEDARPAGTKVKLTTSMGDIVILLDEEKAPVTCANFLKYVGEGYYDGLVFHRVIRNFMIQGGGFSADLATKPTSAPIINEAKNGLSNKRGTIAMARTRDPNSATSQFFINHRDNNNLDYGGPTGAGYAVFGRVIEGINIVDSIAVVPTTTKKAKDGRMLQDVPATPVVIVSAAVAE